MKMWLWVSFGIACALQWAAPLTQIWNHEQVIARGELFRFKCAAPDPYDLFRGRFLAVRALPDAADVAKDHNLQYGESAYAALAADKDGLATVKSLSRTQPASGAFITVKTRHVIDGKASIDWPFDRFYLNENIAPKADEWYRQNIRSSDSVIAEVRVLDGRAVLVDLKQGGRSFREMLKEMPADK